MVKTYVLSLSAGCEIKQAVKLVNDWTVAVGGAGSESACAGLCEKVGMQESPIRLDDLNSDVGWL